MEDIAGISRFSDGLIKSDEDTYYSLYGKIPPAWAFLPGGRPS